MTKFKNIQKNNIGFSTPLTPPVARQEALESRKKDAAVRAKSPRVEEKKRTPVPAPRPIAAKAAVKAKSSSRIGKSVIVLSLVVIIQIALLISLLYLTPSLIR